LQPQAAAAPPARRAKKIQAFHQLARAIRLACQPELSSGAVDRTAPEETATARQLLAARLEADPGHVSNLPNRPRPLTSKDLWNEVIDQSNG
jgi:hypothetical protein